MTGPITGFTPAGAAREAALEGQLRAIPDTATARTQTLVGQYFEDTRAYLERWLPAFEAQDRAYVTVAIGCTGGQHRSVYLAERLGQAFEGRFEQVVVKHRELGG